MAGLSCCRHTPQPTGKARLGDTHLPVAGCGAGRLVLCACAIACERRGRGADALALALQRAIGQPLRCARRGMAALHVGEAPARPGRRRTAAGAVGAADTAHGECARGGAQALAHPGLFVDLSAAALQCLVLARQLRQ
jgi:hypothetical protein